MGHHVLLDNIQHHDLRLITRHGAAFGDNVNQVLIFPHEFNEIHRHYPIFFRKTETGGFKAIAILGFDKDENLFLEGEHWSAPYVPAAQKISPFLIGQPQPVPGQELPADAEAMILVNPANARISKSQGEPLFLAHGGHSPALMHITQILKEVYDGSQISDRLFASFYEAGLLAPVEIDVKLDESRSYLLKDMFTVSREALQSLDGNTLKSLNEAGFLAIAFYVVSSLSNLSHLINLKNRRDSVAATA